MSWERGQRYRGKLVSGQLQVEKHPTTGTLKVAGLIECTLGPNLGQRLRWSGYLNSTMTQTGLTNAENTIAELRATGWKGAKLGTWEGAGSREVEFTLMADEGEGANKGKTFFKAAFLRALTTLKSDNAVDDLDAINAQLGHVLATVTEPRGPVPAPPPRSNGAAAPPVESVENGETQEIPF